MDDSDDYHRFVAAAADDCYCCLDCGDVPCAGVLAGGFCDTRCHCDELGRADEEHLELGGEGGCA